MRANREEGGGGVAGREEGEDSKEVIEGCVILLVEEEGELKGVVE